MEFLLAVLAIAVTLLLAKRGILHPGDYLVAAALAVMLALFVLVITPGAAQTNLLVAIGAPLTAVARAEFMSVHGVRIVLASLLFAAVACAGAEIRRRATPEQFA